MEISVVVDDIRRRSRTILDSHGIHVVDSLPALDIANLRPSDEILSRLFCLNTVVAASYGLPAAKALSWLYQEQLHAKLTPVERSFLEEGRGDRDAFQIQVEGMWALAWALSIVSEIDFWRDCSDTFVTVLPNLKTGEGVRRVVERAKLRDTVQIVEALDLSYCLHWLIRETALKKEPLPRDLKPYVIEERRRALEWVLSDARWEAISPDT